MREVDTERGGRYQVATTKEFVVYLGPADGKAQVRNHRGREYTVPYDNLAHAEEVPERVQPPKLPHGHPTHSVDHPHGYWLIHGGWAAPVWHDREDPTPVHLYDLTHARVPQPVRDRALLALRLLVDPLDPGWPE